MNRFCQSFVAATLSLVSFCFSATAQVPSAADFKLPDGFVADLVYEVPKSQGSWVVMTPDPQGRLIVCDQFGSLYRVSLGNKTTVKPIELEIGNAQGLLCAFGSLYVMSSGNDGRNGRPECEPGLYRVTDTDGDDKFDEAKHLRKIVGRGEHGPHAILLGPDKKSLYVCAGNMTGLPEIEYSRQAKVWQEDQLLTRFSDPRGHASGIRAPGGWICKTDPDGKSFELVGSGFRNEYDITFDPNGELFTFDADMEWDFGLAWYRPTRICHVVSGAEFGWRNGSGKWPTYFPDSVPPAVEIGPGSPTGITFGSGANFPAKYQRTLFAADWSYGFIYAVHLEADGGTYRGSKEIFCSAPAMPVTDIVVNPSDGHLYIAIGGRRTRSALYRIRYAGDANTDPVSYPKLTPLAQQRREIELMHESDATIDIQKVVAALDSPHRAIRYAARIALEKMPIETWQSELNKNAGSAKLEMLLAASRVAIERTDLIANALSRLDFESLSVEQQHTLLRACSLFICRSKTKKTLLLRAIAGLEPALPSGDSLVDLELGKLLVAAESPAATAKMVDLMLKGESQELQVGFCAALSDAKAGWNSDLRKKYFQWFLDSSTAFGGNSFDGYVAAIRKNAISNLSKIEATALKDLLAKRPEKSDPYAELNAREVVQHWTLEDFANITPDDLNDRDVERGKKMFAVATCYKCHRIQGRGGIVGPDLTPAGRRFNAKDLIETIIDPNKAVSDQYEMRQYLLEDGRVIVGRVVNLSGKTIRVQPDMAQPSKLETIQVGEIEESMPSTTSPMPSGLLDTLSRDEILDLLAYLKSTSKIE